VTLAPASVVRQLLRCPRCADSLIGDMPGLRCPACGIDFQSTAGQPILLDDSTEAASIAAAGLNGEPSGLARSTRAVRRNLAPAVGTALANVRSFRSHLPQRARLMIVGGGLAGHGVQALISDPDLDVIAFDIYPSEMTQFVADGHDIPLPNSSFDGVLVQAVLEHVLAPERIVGEIHRVLRPEGVVYAETAFMQHVHEGAHDFIRFTERGHRWLFRAFDEIEGGPIGGPALQLLWSIDYLVRGLTGSRRAGLRVRRALSVLERLDRRVRMEHRVDAAPAVFFLGRRSSAPGLSSGDLLGGYRGPTGNGSAGSG